ncbi:hypothetical protein LTR66_014196, partial [Elasticomyces elasticus]
YARFLRTVFYRVRTRMAECTSASRPQTIKQAKAAYKARGRPTISAKEQRQIDRGAELLRRANRITDRERRRREALREKQEEEAREKEEARNTALLGTQRKLDCFGHKSSQFHLGAFFGRGLNAVGKEAASDKGEEPWEEDEVDDDSILGACIPQETALPAQDAQRKLKTTPGSETHLESALLHSKPHPPAIPSAPNIDCWADFLDSSTQIARDLAAEDTPPPPPPAAPASPKHSTDSSCGEDFDLSPEELDQLDRSTCILDQIKTSKSAPMATTISAHAMLPPPPPEPLARSTLPGIAMPPPPRPTKLAQTRDVSDRIRVPPSSVKPPARTPRATGRVSKPPWPAPAVECSSSSLTNFGVTLADLEAMADFDLQPTQCCATSQGVR